MRLSISIRPCTEAECGSVLDLWRRAQVTPSVTDTLAAIIRMVRDDSALLLVAEAVVAGTSDPGNSRRTLAGTVIAGLGRLAWEHPPAGGGPRVPPAWHRAFAGRRGGTEASRPGRRACQRVGGGRPRWRASLLEGNGEGGLPGASAPSAVHQGREDHQGAYFGTLAVTMTGQRAVEPAVVPVRR